MAKKPKTTYRWKPGSRFKVKIDVAMKTLDEIRANNNGVLNPENTVEAARDPDSPIHDEFNWNDDEAAEYYRRDQARNLIYSIWVEEEKDEPTQNHAAFVSVEIREGGRSYLPVSTAMSDKEYREQSLAEALTSLEGWRRRFAHLQEVAEAYELASARLRVPTKRKKAG